ncbi:hypothetical protein LLH00_11835 [bacterium]|nr:hypothetical protein [bacterium]
MDFALTERLVLRCDGSRSLGLGHLARCAMLAANLAAPGRSRLVCREDPLARRFVAERALEASFIPRSCSPEEEADLLADLCITDSAQFVLLDRRDNSLEYVSTLVRAGLFVVDIEDRGPGRCESHILIDSHIWPGSEEAGCRGKPLCGFGPDWALIDLRYARAAACLSLTPEAERLQTVREVVVSLGGSDPAGLTRVVLGQIDRVEGDFRVSLVAGPGVDTSGLACSFHELRLLRGLRCLDEVFSGAQLAVVSGGVTMLEALCVGVPVLVVPQHREQYVNAARFALRAGLSLAPPPEDAAHRERIFRALEQIIEDPVLRVGLARAGAALVDGHALERLAGTMAYLESARREKVFGN